MASGPPIEMKEEEEEEEEEEEAPSHLPLAPSSELYDTSTTVDPSYIISLIRQLLPRDAESLAQKVEDTVNSIQGSELGCQEKDLTVEKGGDNVDYAFVDQKSSSNSNMENGMSEEFGKEETSVGFNGGQTNLLEKKDPWEDCGCILWDLSANLTHAEFMVNNLLLEVLLANLRISTSLRAMEICLGIIGNLACHDVLSNAIVSANGLIETVVEQLFLDDSTCLSEVFRLLAAGLQGSKHASWVEVLIPEQILQRILWIIGNTLNSMLLEKSIEFLMIIINKQEVSSILLQHLIKLGLSNLVAGLLAGELSKLRDENSLERCSVLDLILGLVEALSTTDSYSQVIASNKELFALVCGVLKLPDKIEVASSCVSAVIIIANILVDDTQLTLELSQDFSFLQCLLDIFPFVSDDPQARDALWCVVARLLSEVQVNGISISDLQQFASLFVEKFHLIEEDIEGHHMEDSRENSNSPSAHQSHATTSSLRRIACILEKWMVEKSAVSEKVDIESDDDHGGKLHRLLNYCHKYVRLL